MKVVVLLLCLLFGVVVAQIDQKFDSRTGFPNCVGEILNQGDCGSCWAFGATESFTDRNCIFGDSQFSTPNRIENSPEDIVACDSVADGCNGGWAQTAWSVINAQGLSTCTDGCTSGCHPYTSVNCSEGANGANNGCESCPTATCADGSNYQAFTAGNNGAIMPYGSYNSVQAMQIEIQKNGPVESCFTVYDNFFSFFAAQPDGIYNQTSGQVVGGHCIKIIGWDSTGPMPYWIIANSWTTGWGNNGFFNYALGTDLGGMDSSGYAGCPSYSTCQLTFPLTESKNKGILAGAWTPISPTASYVQKAFIVGREKIMAQFQTLHKEQIKMSIIDAHVQPVAGLHIRINVNIESPNLPHRVAVITAFMDLTTEVFVRNISL